MLNNVLEVSELVGGTVGTRTQESLRPQPMLLSTKLHFPPKQPAHSANNNSSCLLSTFCESKMSHFSKFLFIYFIFGCTGSSLLCRLFSSCGERGVAPQLWYVGFSLRWLLLLWSTGSWVPRLQQLWLLGSVVVVHWLSGPTACGIFPNQGSNPCPLHRQVDS